MNKYPKQRLSLIFALFFLAPTAMSQDKNFRLDLSILTKERSKDSHTTHKKWTIHEGTLYRNSSYSGRTRPNQKDESTKKLLETAQIEKIKAYIAENDLYQNIPSPKYSDFKTPYVATEVSFIVNRADESFQIQLYDISSEMLKDEVYQKLEKLRSLLEDFLE